MDRPEFSLKPSFLFRRSTGLLAACCALGVQTGAFAQEYAPRQRVFATPLAANSNPFMPTELADVELPVALSGFSTVALLDHQQWREGSPQLQLVFDGQIYWFTSARELSIFAASPLKYAPVLGGDCVVTYVETGRRMQGQLQHALTHGGRLYLFHNAERIEQFRSDPSRFADGDLAEAGRCIVTKFDEGRQFQGLPETAAVVNGLRYLFAGDFQRRQFAANMGRYGVMRRLLTPDGETDAVQSLQSNATSMAQDSASSAEEAAKPLPKGGKDDSFETPAMDGYCPVSILEKGIWVRGRFEFETRHFGKLYHLAGEKEKELFELQPAKFAPALGGDCLVTKVQSKTDVPGTVHHPWYDVEKERLYLFAGPELLEAFHADRDRYLKQVEMIERALEESQASQQPADETAPADQSGQ